MGALGCQDSGKKADSLPTFPYVLLKPLSSSPSQMWHSQLSCTDFCSLFSPVWIRWTCSLHLLHLIDTWIHFTLDSWSSVGTCKGYGVITRGCTWPYAWAISFLPNRMGSGPDFHYAVTKPTCLHSICVNIVLSKMHHCWRLCRLMAPLCVCKVTSTSRIWREHSNSVILQ